MLNNKRKNIKVSTEAMLTCPYCFGKFTHDRVHFKAMTVKSKADIRDVEETFAIDEKGEKEKKEKKEKITAFLRSNDAIYREFWEKYPGSKNEWAYADYPVITPKNREKMCIGEFVRDNEGMVEKAKDIFGNDTNIRICPHCHNPLPRGYGRKPVKFLAVVGITNSGKTVYLSQLLKGIQQYAANVGVAVHPCTENETKFVKDFAVKKGEPLFIGTPKNSLSIPLFYDFDKYTLVVYDIAGENCVKAEEMPKFGPFILNADGIILLLAPEQFTMINDDNEHETATPVAVLDAMFNAFVQDVGKVNIPLAVTFSKSDELKEKGSEFLHGNSRIFQELTTKGHKFDEVTHRNIHGELAQMIQNMPEGKALQMSLQRNYSEWAYFAVSALGCGVEELEKKDETEETRHIPIQNPHPYRIEEPLLWILWKWGAIEAVEAKDTAPERKFRPFFR